MEKTVATREELFELFDKLGINHVTHEHRPVFSVDEGHDIKENIDGGHTKNLFLKDKDGKFFLICALGDTRIRLNQVHKAIKSARLSFGSEEKLFEILGVRPGSVTLYSLINDKNHKITLILDKAIFDHRIINFHPLLNDATTGISIADMNLFIKNWGGEVMVCDFTEDLPQVLDYNSFELQ